jgi:hypothetical protein
VSEKCKCGADAKYRMALSDDTCAECHIVELNEGMQRQLAAQRRTIATLRARLSNRDGANRSRWYRHKLYLKNYDALRSSYESVTKRTDNKSRRVYLRRHHNERIAAIRNFGALP